MICPNKHEEGVECPYCRDLATVWKRLDEFAAPEVAPDFDARLYARIAAEETRRASGWRHVWRRWFWLPIAPVAAVAAAGVVAVVLYTHVPRSIDNPQQVIKVEIEQVAQAVDDLDLLTPIVETRDR